EPRAGTSHRTSVFTRGLREIPICGLSLGLRVYLAKIHKGGSPGSDPGEVRQLEELAAQIEDFWSLPENQKSSSWTDHEDINAIMLSSSMIATACPEVFC
ncbi:MAG: hypothetical protein WD708_02560, partial [Kiritimatiellia bacterium]